MEKKLTKVTHVSYLPDHKSTRLWVVAGRARIAEYWYSVSKQEEMKQSESGDFKKLISLFT